VSVFYFCPKYIHIQVRSPRITFQLLGLRAVVVVGGVAVVAGVVAGLVVGEGVEAGLLGDLIA